jgi:AcrR family transcriptional regulator
MTKRARSLPEAPPAPQPSAPRRLPAQQRSRERLERILGAASELIAHKGSDTVKMNEIAELAQISIGSLYQYFPDKRAIVRTLAERYAATNQACVRDALAPVTDLDSLLKAFAQLVDEYYKNFLAEPVMRDIWSGMQADKQLVALEQADNEVSGALFTAAMRRAHPRANAKRIATTAFLIWQLGEAAMRLAITHGRSEGALLVEAYKRMALRAIAQP